MWPLTRRCATAYGQQGEWKHAIADLNAAVRSHRTKHTCIIVLQMHGLT